jgi:hypothetical protein
MGHTVPDQDGGGEEDKAPDRGGDGKRDPSGHAEGIHQWGAGDAETVSRRPVGGTKGSVFSVERKGGHEKVGVGTEGLRCGTHRCRPP